LEEHQQDVGPIVHKLTPAAFDDLLESIAERESADPLVFFDARTQKSFIVSMACRLSNLLKDKSFFSLPSNESDSESLTNNEND
jgi:hypothetical protein